MACRTENIVALGMLLIASSTVSMGCVPSCPLDHLLRSLGSMHMYTLSFLRETTIDLTHSVCCSTFKMWPSLWTFISLSFSITLAPGSILTEYVPGGVPVMLAKSGNSYSSLGGTVVHKAIVHRSI